MYSGFQNSGQERRTSQEVRELKSGVKVVPAASLRRTSQEVRELKSLLPTVFLFFGGRTSQEVRELKSLITCWDAPITPVAPRKRCVS